MESRWRWSNASSVCSGGTELWDLLRLLYVPHEVIGDEEGVAVLRELSWALHNQGWTLLPCFTVNPFWEENLGLLLEGGHETTELVIRSDER